MSRWITVGWILEKKSNNFVSNRSILSTSATRSQLVRVWVGSYEGHKLLGHDPAGTWASFLSFVQFARVLYSLYSLLEFLYEVGTGSWRLTSQQLARLSNILFGSCFAFCQLTRAWSGSPGSVEWYGQGITQVKGTGVTRDKGPWVLVQSGEARLFWCVMEWTAYGDCWGH